MKNDAARPCYRKDDKGFIKYLYFWPDTGHWYVGAELRGGKCLACAGPGEWGAYTPDQAQLCTWQVLSGSKFEPDPHVKVAPPRSTRPQRPGLKPPNQRSQPTLRVPALTGGPGRSLGSLPVNTWGSSVASSRCTPCDGTDAGSVYDPDGLDGPTLSDVFVAGVSPKPSPRSPRSPQPQLAQKPEQVVNGLQHELASVRQEVSRERAGRTEAQDELNRMRKQLKETQKRLDNEKRTRLRAEEKLGAVIKQVRKEVTPRTRVEPMPSPNLSIEPSINGATSEDGSQASG